MNLGAWTASAGRSLQDSGIASFALESQLLAAHATGKDRAWVLAHPDFELDSKQAAALQAVLDRRLGHEPLAYIVGEREFYGRMFLTGPGVLIPRQETELLVERTLALAPPGASVLDIGTGSGCIAITLKLERPDLQVTASDISSDALEVASRNAEHLGADVHMLQSNLFDSTGSDRWDWIVSNPPYVAISDPLEPEVKDFEPSQALYGGEDGLDFYRILAKEAGSRLTSDGHIALEIGAGQLPEVSEIFKSRGWTELETRDDLAAIPRVCIFQRKP